MLMPRRLLSHLLISLAIFSLVATFYVWFIDSVILNPSKLVPVLKEEGVPSAIASVLPEQASKDADPAEVADMRAKIAQVVTPEYVSEKITVISTSITTFIKNGEPQPVLDLSDFPAQLRASGVEVGEDLDKNFAEPIELNKNGNLDTLPDAYKTFKLFKILGIVIVFALLIAEWFVAAKGEKLKRVGRVFMHTAIWFFVFWALIAFLPSKVLPRLKANIPEENIHQLVDAVAKSIQHLFGDYFLSFAIVCAVIAAILYIIRYVGKHYFAPVAAAPVTATQKKPASPVQTKTK